MQSLANCGCNVIAIKCDIVRHIRGMAAPGQDDVFVPVKRQFRFLGSGKEINVLRMAKCRIEMPYTFERRTTD